MTRKAHRRSKAAQAILALIATCFIGAVGLAEPRNPRAGQNRPAENTGPNTSSRQTGSGTDSEIHAVPVQGNIYMLVGAGGNITVQVDNDGILLVDTGLAQMSDKVLSAIRTISNKPIRFIINTSADKDVVGGNEAIAKVGSSISPPVGADGILHYSDIEIKGASIISFQSALDRMSDPKSEDLAPKDAWPFDTYTSGKKSIFFNNDRIQIYHQPAAHTDGDSIVLFHLADVVSAGGIFTTTSYPVIDMARGGSIQGIIAGLNRLVYDLTASGEKEEGGTLVIPSHGRLCDQSDVIYFQEMVTIIRDRVQDMIKRGMTLDQVKQAGPTKDYDPRYGSTSGAWTTDMFVEAVYKSLTAEKGKLEKQ